MGRVITAVLSALLLGSTPGSARIGLRVRTPSDALTPAVHAAGDLARTGATSHADGIVNVRDYGALGDGIADDGAAIQAAIDAATVTGGRVEFPLPGNYMVARDITADETIFWAFAPGAKLIVGEGTTVTIESPQHIVAHLTQHVFQLVGTGRVVFDLYSGGRHNQGGIIYPQWWGAVADKTVDSTAAIQAAIDAAAFSLGRLGYAWAEVRLLPGEYGFTNLTLPQRTILKGSGFTTTTLYRMAGSTGAAITETDRAIKTVITDLQIYCNDCEGDALNLGNLDLASGQFGAGARLERLWIRRAKGRAFDVFGNVAWLTTVDVSQCTGGAILRGNGNLVTDFVDMSQDAAGDSAVNPDYGLEITGVGNLIQNAHFEGHYRVAALRLNGHTNYINGVNVNTQATLPAAIKIETNKYGNMIHGLVVYAFEGAAITTCIIDESYGSRSVPGTRGITDRHRVVPLYTAGRFRQFYEAGIPYSPVEGTWRIGDLAWPRDASAGWPAWYICTANGSPGTWAAVGAVPGAIAKESDYTVSVADNGKRFSNAGATGPVTFLLCPAASNLEFEFVRVESYPVYVAPQGKDCIRGGGSGKALILDTDGDLVRLGCFKKRMWDMIRIVDPNGADRPFDFEP